LPWEREFKGLRKKRIEIDKISRERKGKSVVVGEVGRKSRLKIEREREGVRVKSLARVCLFS
jgi:hypothetical protein